MNPFSGIFHYEFDKEKGNQDLAKVDSKAHGFKKKYYSLAASITVVGPSAWITKKSNLSELMKDFKHHNIYNCIDERVFRLTNKKYARDILNIPQDKMVFLYVSDNLGNNRKGSDLLSEVLPNITKVDNQILVTVGKGQIMSNDVLELGEIIDDRVMASAYNSADAIILPSREDNLPNVMIESLACGTPVIGFRIGGVEDEIEDGFNGYSSSQVTVRGLIDSINKFKSKKLSWSSEEISLAAHQKYSIKPVSSKYLELYSQVLMS